MPVWMCHRLQLEKFSAESSGVNMEGPVWGWASRECLREELVMGLRYGV